MDEEFRKLVKAFERVGDKTGYLTLFSTEELLELMLQAGLKLLELKIKFKVVRTDLDLMGRVSDVKQLKEKHLELRIEQPASVMGFDWRYITNVAPNYRANTLFIPKNLVFNDGSSHPQYWIFARTAEVTPELLKKEQVKSEKKKQAKVKSKITKLQNKLVQAEELKKELEAAKEEAEKAGIKLED